MHQSHRSSLSLPINGIQAEALLCLQSVSLRTGVSVDALQALACLQWFDMNGDAPQSLLQKMLREEASKCANATTPKHGQTEQKQGQSIPQAEWAAHLAEVALTHELSLKLEAYTFGKGDGSNLSDEELEIYGSKAHPMERMRQMKALRRTRGMEKRRETQAREQRHSWSVLVTQGDTIRARSLGVLLS